MPQVLEGSNNTNKLSPQERYALGMAIGYGSNNTNKLSPQEHIPILFIKFFVQIIQINLVLKNKHVVTLAFMMVQIIQINLVLKNRNIMTNTHFIVQIIQINLVLKNRRPYYSIFMLYLQYILSISIIKC